VWPTIEAPETRDQFEKEEMRGLGYFESKTYFGIRVIEEYGEE
jgi:hypothetical protein